MASLSAIRDGIKTVIKGQISTMNVYDTVADVTHLPAIIVGVDPKESADFTGAMGRGMDTWNILVYILVARGTDVVAAQEQLDQYLSGGGPKSVREALWNRPELALSDGTDLTVVGLEKYGGSFDTANIPCVGAILRTVVRTPGTA